MALYGCKLLVDAAALLTDVQYLQANAAPHMAPSMVSHPEPVTERPTEEAEVEPKHAALGDAGGCAPSLGC